MALPRARVNMKEIGKNGIEAYLKAQVERRGGLCLKQNANWYIGIPDRLVCLPGLMALIETKRPKGSRVTPAQIKWQGNLTKMGLAYYRLHSVEEVDAFLRKWPLKR
jgi:hypothetical protein